MLSIRERIPVGISEEILGEIFEEILGEVSEKNFEFKFPKESLKNFLIDMVSFFGQRFRRRILHPWAFQLFSKNLVNWVSLLLVLHKPPRFSRDFLMSSLQKKSAKMAYEQASKTARATLSLLTHLTVKPGVKAKTTIIMTVSGTKTFQTVMLDQREYPHNNLEKFLNNRSRGSSDGFSGGISKDLFLLINFWRNPF